MPDHATAGVRVGTFEGRYGDQRGLAATMNEVVIRACDPDPESGEARVELVTRAHKPVDAPEMRVELPAHAVERTIEVLAAALDG